VLKIDVSGAHLGRVRQRTNMPQVARIALVGCVLTGR
jgi:hypothetical protein